MSTSKKWRPMEDKALMSAWIIVSTNAIHGKNNQAIIIWKKVWEIYEEERCENPGKIGPRNQEGMRSRWKKINETANKWVSCYNAVVRRGKKSGTNEADVVAAAQELYKDSDPKGKYYQDLPLFDEVLCKNVKWSLEQMNYNFSDELSSQSRSSSKRSRPDETDISAADDDDEPVPETPPSVNRTESRAPPVNFSVNGHSYNMAYYLTDGIYSPWATFVKSINAPQIRKHKLFAQYQEGVKKDVERAFGVLQARFAYIKRPCLVWDRGLMGKILMTCIIMHNMIVEDERDTYQNQYNTNVDHQEDEDDVGGTEPFHYSTTSSNLQTYIATRTQLRSRETHNALTNDLIEHIWGKFGHRN